MKRRLLATFGAAAILGACDSPTIPPRLEAYDFTLAIPDGPSLVFRWPAGSQVGVYVSASPEAGRTSLEEAVNSGIYAWNAAVLFDEYRLSRVESPAEAKIVVVWSDDQEHPVFTSGCRPDIGRAVTTFCTEDEDLRTLKPFPLSTDASANSPVRFLITIGSSQADDPELLDRLVAHELGHALGIFRHSPNNDDLMTSGLIQTRRPSAIDRNTIQILYHTAPDIRP